VCSEYLITIKSGVEMRKGWGGAGDGEKEANTEHGKLLTFKEISSHWICNGSF
jgi:hypothetical protein